MSGRRSYETCGRRVTRGFTQPQRTQRTPCSFVQERLVHCVHGGDVTVALPRCLVMKFGGELLEDRAHLATVVGAIASIGTSGTPVAIVHGGGKEIDAALKIAGLEKRQVDGLRVTDEPTLDVVVSVLAGA